MTLDQKLAILSREVVKATVDELAKPNFNPAEHWREMPYLKDDLAKAIVNEIEQRGIPIATEAETLYGSLNKEPMKRIIYGFKSMPDVPQEFFAAIHDDTFGNWMELYFAAGKWAENEMPSLFEYTTLTDLTAHYIRSGITRLNYEHYRRKHRGEYTSNAELPFDSQIRHALNRAIENSRKSGMLTIGQYLSEGSSVESQQPIQLKLF